MMNDFLKRATKFAAERGTLIFAIVLFLVFLFFSDIPKSVLMFRAGIALWLYLFLRSD